MVGLAHYRDKTAVDELIAVMTEDVRPMIRGTAAWSLGKIGTEKAFEAIEKALAKETDERVIYEMEKGLAFREKYERSEERRVGKERKTEWERKNAQYGQNREISET